MRTILYLTVVLGLAAWTHAATTVTFDNVADLDNNFNKSTGADFSHGLSSGLSSGGGVLAPAGTRQVLTFINGENLVNGQTYTCSMYYKYSGPNNGHNTLGFVGSDTGDAETAFGYGLRENGLGVAFDANDLLIVNTEGAGSTTSGSHTASVVGNWYFLELSMTFNGGNSFSITTSMYNSQDDGVVGAQIGTLSDTMNHNLLSGAPGIYATFGGNLANGTFSQMDNFSTTAIPEPATTVLIGGAGLGLILARRMKTLQLRLGKEKRSTSPTSPTFREHW